jgi:hypothetical protein
LTLPPGSYEARIWFADQRPREGDIVVSSFERAVFGRTAAASHSPVVVQFALPVTIRRLVVSASEAPLAAAAVRVEVVPTAVVPASERARDPVRTVESIGEDPGAYLVYTNEHSYPEGGVFWTRGTEPAAVLVAPGGASTIRLTLFSGPQTGPVRVVAAGREHTVQMEAGQTSELAIPTEGRRLMPVTVQSSAFFRPADVDPGSTDTRGLGCQVRVSVG